MINAPIRFILFTLLRIPKIPVVVAIMKMKIPKSPEKRNTIRVIIVKIVTDRKV